MVDIANFIAQNSPRFNLAAVDREHYANALAQNQVSRIPQMNRAQDLEIQATEQALDFNRQKMSQAQIENARGVLARGFASVAQSADPLRAGRDWITSQEFRAAGALVPGFPVDQFSVVDGDDPEQIRSRSIDTARRLGSELEFGASDGAKFGVTPQFGVDAQGNVVPIQFNDKGGAQVTQLPDGVSISRTPIRLDLGTEWGILDPITRQVVSRQPKNIEGAQAAEQIGDWVGKAYADIQTAGMDAGQRLNRLTKLELLADQIETGRLAGVKKTLGEFAQAFGVDVEGLDEIQAFQALSNQFALEMRNPSGGAGMPGALSDRDLEFLTRTVPNILNTPGGNKQIIGFAKALAQRNQQVAGLARAYKRRTGKMDEQFLDELAQWAEANPLFTEAQPAAPGGRDITPLLDKYAPRSR